MSDLLQELNDAFHADDPTHLSNLCNDAATEIRKLRTDLQTAREDAMEGCCRDVCCQCIDASRADSEVRGATRRDYDGRWEHEYTHDNIVYWCDCQAEAIRERVMKEQTNEQT